MQDEELVAAVRSAPGPGRSLFDEPTRMGNIDEHLLDQTRPEEALQTDRDNPRFIDAATEMSGNPFSGDDEKTRMASVESITRSKSSRAAPAKAPPAGKAPSAARPRPRLPPPGTAKPDERTRAVDIRGDGINDPSINDIDWDID